MSENLELRAGQFIKLRDLKKTIEDRHEEELKEINETLEQLKDVMAKELNAVGADSVKTTSGTVSFTSKATASLADASAFWNHCVVTGNFDLIDKKANVTAVRDYIDQNGVAPPGVNWNVFKTIGVRRPTGK
jgi:hypothetical protein